MQGLTEHNALDKKVPHKMLVKLTYGEETRVGFEPQAS